MLIVFILLSFTFGINANTKKKIIEDCNYLEQILNKEYVVKTRDVDYIKENKIIKSTEIVLSFVITSINEDGVTIHTNDSFSLDGAGMFLKGEQKDFKVLKGDSLKLTTLTLDYGYIFIFSLE